MFMVKSPFDIYIYLISLEVSITYWFGKGCFTSILLAFGVRWDGIRDSVFVVTDLK